MEDSGETTKQHAKKIIKTYNTDEVKRKKEGKEWRKKPNYNI